MTSVETTPRAAPLDNPRRERFAQEYVLDFNGAQAYVRAGYSPRGARTSASKLLADPNIISRVQYLVDRRAEKLEYEGERVMLETARVAMSDICDVLEITDEDGVIIFPSETWSEHARRAVESVKQTETFDKNGNGTSRRIELKMHSKLGALTLLSQQIGVIGKAASRAPGGLKGLDRLGIFILPALDPEPDWDAQENGNDPGDGGYRIALPPLDPEKDDDQSAPNG